MRAKDQWNCLHCTCYCEVHFVSKLGVKDQSNRLHCTSHHVLFASTVLRLNLKESSGKSSSPDGLSKFSVLSVEYFTSDFHLNDFWLPASLIKIAQTSSLPFFLPFRHIRLDGDPQKSFQFPLRHPAWKQFQSRDKTDEHCRRERKKVKQENNKSVTEDGLRLTCSFR